MAGGDPICKFDNYKLKPYGVQETKQIKWQIN